MEFTVEPMWSWPVVILTAAALIAFVLVTNRVQSRTLSTPRSRWLLVWKLAAVAVLIFAMFRPAVQFTEQDENKVQLLIAVDVSRSMNTADAAAGATRLTAALQDLDRQSERWQELAQKATIRRFEFDQDLRPFLDGRTSGDGDSTALGKTLESLLREARLDRTLGILLLSDGAQRAVPPNDVDPFPVARQLAQAQTPVYTLGYGATSLSSTAADLALRDLLVDPVVFERKLVPIKVQLQAIGAAGKAAKVRVLVEDRTGKTIGESGELKPATVSQNSRVLAEIPIKANEQVESLDLSFLPQRPGEVKIAVEVEPLDGEILNRNNRVETIITVRQGGLRVAYFDSGRPEQKYLRMVNGAEQIQLDWYEVRRGRFRNRTRIDPAIFERGAYDVYVIGDVPADVFGPALIGQLAARVNEGAGLLMLGGLENYGAGGYGRTPLADLLPVVLPLEGATVGPDRANQLEGPQLMVPTETGLQRYVMQLASGERNRALWAQLAPLVGATKLQPKSDFVEIWARSPDGTPLLCATEVGRARVAAFGGDTTYQWVMHNQGVEHQRFWRQMILWLARKEADSNQQVWARIDPRNHFPGSTVPIEMGARNLDGTPVPDAEFAVEITKPDGAKEQLAARRSGDQAIAEFPAGELAGDYWVRVTARKGGQVIGVDASTRFIVDPRDLELDQPNADYETLGKIAELSGGQLLRSEEMEAFITRLSTLKFGELSRVTTLPLWDNWILLLAFVSLMTAEWWCRKRWGLA